MRILHYINEDDGQEFIVLTEEKGIEVKDEYRVTGFHVQNDIEFEIGRNTLPLETPLYAR